MRKCMYSLAIVAVHSQSVIHGDLSGNIDKNGIALLPTNPTCTAPYMAPEYLIFDDEGNVSLAFSPKSDVYSFGGIMLQVLEGKIPYHYVARYEAIIHCISQGIRPRGPPAPVVGDVDWDFIQSCWSPDMEHRPSGEAILEFVEGRAVLN
ncbi:kinase-like domain-containing protein [Suillus fuscotomentosus]|uniref:Kinase-like domain-containing protein n=1 Tax=Suillus fuscotomentosus TaxID=1912939 RepID=A0AAD4HQF1_9AGAM|nr:kinase-like domain-containing protein [Suillus fuscotomentosus]KAG1906285.1 kinase-like domain-containing protein [Suillus fuscotomentosus]